jgi:NhaP-type Na+/H+ or K+/H+ antiporter/Trk K+ transport system NAD-binding subunit
MTDVLIQISWIAFFVMGAQWIGWSLKTPAIVFLLIGGFIAGPVFNLVTPDALLGDLLSPFISMAVGIILFEGSLNLNFKEIREAKRSIKHVILIGGPVAWILTSLAGFYVAGLSWPVALTFGALLIVTGPTVIMPLLKNAHLKERPASILKWEGIINDAIGAVLAILCYEFFKISLMEHHDLTTFVMSTILAIILIIFFGILLAYCTAKLFNRDLVPEYLKPPFLLGAVVIFFTLCNTIEHDFGLIGVTIFGVALANMGVTSIEEIKRFKETLSVLLVSSVFILITANIDPAILLAIDWRGFAFIALLMFVIRPIAMSISSIGTKMTWKEVILTGWIAPRGIVCAAVAGVLGPLLVGLGYEDGNQLVALAFAIVLATVFAHGLSAKPLGQKLGLAYAGRDSLIIVGSSSWAIEFSKALINRGVDVIIADKNWHALRAARLADIPTYFGEVLSEETEYHLELARYNMLLAVTNNPAYNALICTQFIHEFGRDKVYQFLPHAEQEHESRQIDLAIRGQTFGCSSDDYWDISALLSKGWRFRTSRVGQGQTLDEIMEKQKAGTLKILGSLTPKNRLILRSPQDIGLLDPEHILIAFEQPDDKQDVKPGT